MGKKLKKEQLKKIIQKYKELMKLIKTSDTTISFTVSKFETGSRVLNQDNPKRIEAPKRIFSMSKLY